LEAIIIQDISFDIDADLLAESLRINNIADKKKLSDIAREAKSLCRPKALYAQSYIESRGDDFILIGGVRLEGRLLSANLRSIGCVFPYIATCGKELEDWLNGLEGVQLQFWADSIKMLALDCATDALIMHIRKLHETGPISSMNPGSLPEWPIDEQKKLFQLIGSRYADIGVELKESGMMTPLHTVSGIFFSSESGYVNCSICKREECRIRKAPYDRALHENICR
jgi:hypothetical protein